MNPVIVHPAVFTDVRYIIKLEKESGHRIEVDSQGRAILVAQPVSSRITACVLQGHGNGYGV